MRCRDVAAFVLSVAAATFCARDAAALINPKFTPVHLVKESDVILQLKVAPESGDGRIIFTVENILKGKQEGKTVEVDLTASDYPDQAKFADKVAKESSDKLALMFVGAWSDKPGEQAEGAVRRAFVHMEGAWLVLADNNGAWKFEQVSQPLVATWNGGTDMLLRAVKYAMDEADAELPVRTGVTWARVLKPAKIAGKVAGAVPVDLKGTGEPLLFVASSAGDRLFACTAENSEDMTAKCKLQSKSAAFAWGDFNGDGRLDLASWDGKNLAVYLQGADGTFTSSAAAELTDCIALSALDVGTPGKPGLLISTKGAPMLLSPQPGATPRRIANGEWPGKNLGTAGACVLADFDGDGLPDVIQLLANGGLFYKGTGLGAFATPVACPVATGEGAGSACLGDWDADGMLDIFIPGNDRCRLWENLGGGRFIDMMKLTGELSYVAKGSAVAGCVGDLNNDGRQDLTILYSAMAPQAFFNRGFRSFGFSLSLDLSRGALLSEAAEGQLAGCVADFTGDGAQDLAVVLKDGQCAVVVRTPTGADLCARTVPSLKSGWTGPVKVEALAEKRMLGAWNVCTGSPPAFLSRSDAGTLKIRWRFPGQPEQSKDVILENKPLTIVIEPPAVKK
jgi:hypothetical protein